MRRMLFAIALAASACTLLPAQTTVLRRYVRVYGEGSTQIKPDQARVQVGVVTEAPTANETATQNAAQAQAVIDALRKLLGQNADIRTVSYSIQPNYSYPTNSTPVLRGFTATNVVEVTTSDLTGVGRVIDTALQAGANRVQSLSFSLKDDTQARAQALRLASQNARAKADVIASGTNIKLGSILMVQEGYAVTPVTYADTRATLGAAVPTTPVESGNVDVRASVTLDIEIVQ